jgi:ankyrin repeat protein
MKPITEEIRVERTQKPEQSSRYTLSNLFSCCLGVKKEESSLSHINELLRDFSSEGEIENCRQLIRDGADCNSTDECGVTCIHRACFSGELEVISVLIANGSNVNPVAYGFTPLHIACANDHLDIARKLLENGADVNMPSVNGNTPIHFVCKNGYMGIIKLLLAKGADVNIPSLRGDTPIDIADRFGHKDIVKLLKEVQK